MRSRDRLIISFFRMIGVGILMLLIKALFVIYVHILHSHDQHNTLLYPGTTLGLLEMWMMHKVQPTNTSVVCLYVWPAVLWVD